MAVLTMAGIPLVYELDINLKPIPSPDAVYPLTGKVCRSGLEP